MGATTRNAGFACFGSATEIWSDKQILGKEQTLALIEKRWKGIQSLTHRFAPQEINYENFGGYELILDKEINADFLNNLNQFLNPIFDSSIFEFRNAQINEFQFGKNVKQLLYNPLEGQIHSGKLLFSLLKLAQAKGIFYFSNSEITQWADGETISIEINHKQSLNTNHLIFCTNAFPPKGVSSIKPGRGQVLVTHEIPNLPFKGCFHFDEGFYYFRNIGNRVLFGGGRNIDIVGETSTEFALHDIIQRNLIHKLREFILPYFDFDIDMQWSGIMAFSETKLPTEIKLDKNIIYSMNCNGMGVSLSPITAKEIAGKF